MGKELDVGAFFNEEEILDLCLEKLARQVANENREISEDDPSVIFVNHYACSKLIPSKYFMEPSEEGYSDPISLTDEEIQKIDDYIDELIKSKSLSILVSDGILEAKISNNGDITYETTEYAKKNLGASDVEFDINGAPISKG